MNNKDQAVNPNRRKICSFVRREGRMTPGQKRAFEENWAQFGLDCESGIYDLNHAFRRDVSCVTLEIGFGMGESLAAMAHEHPENDYIGVEVYRPGVGAFFKRLRDQESSNVRVACIDAVDVLTNNLEDETLDRVQIFFPDPWPKKRHHKRRLIQPDFVALVRKKLKAGGCLHLATDWEHYAEHMLAVMNAAEGFENLATSGDFSERPDWRPVTKFEKRGRGLGHGVWDLIWRKCE